MDNPQVVLKVTNCFGCSHLKVIAEAKIVKAGINAENAAELLMFADAHSCALLQPKKLLSSCALQILSQYGVQKDGISSRSCQCFLQNTFLVPLLQNSLRLTMRPCESQPSAKNWMRSKQGLGSRQHLQDAL